MESWQNFSMIVNCFCASFCVPEFSRVALVDGLGYMMNTTLYFMCVIILTHLFYFTNLVCHIVLYDICLMAWLCSLCIQGKWRWINQPMALYWWITPLFHIYTMCIMVLKWSNMLRRFRCICSMVFTLERHGSNVFENHLSITFWTIQHHCLQENVKMNDGQTCCS